MFEVSTIGWTATLGLIGALIAVDLWHSRRGAHAIALREAAGWSAFYVGVAVLFGVKLAMIAGWDVGTQYFAGYVVEKSLSLDNLFVFVVIMATFAIPAEQQARLLMIGIVGALLLRTALIALGAAMLDAFSFDLLFGIALTATAVQLFRHRAQDPAVDDNLLIAAARPAAHASRFGGDRDHRHPVRAGFDPGAVRCDRSRLHRLRRERLRYWDCARSSSSSQDCSTGSCTSRRDSQRFLASSA